MKKMLQAYFQFSKLERKGIFVLALLCLICGLIPRGYRLFSKKTKTDFYHFKSEVTAFENQVSQSKKESLIPTYELFDFDPNKVSESDLRRLGLTDKVVQTLVNYRNKGGKFFNKEDLKKVYGLSTSDFKRLESFVVIGQDAKSTKPKSPKLDKEQKNQIDFFDFDPNEADVSELKRLGFKDRVINNLMKFRAKGGRVRAPNDLLKIYGMTESFFESIYPYIQIKKILPEERETNRFDDDSKPITNAAPVVSNIELDVNAATEKDWQKLYGIGPFYASRIITFRDRLGGFYNVEQIGETYGLPDSTFQNIKSQLSVLTEYKKININTASLDDLKSHPYINFKEAKLIVNYRKQHGAFENLKELNKILPLKEDWLDKVSPYFSTKE